ncbi:MAG: hypothetical protein KY459_03135 [Acidobacteria bacterium]|nr:hypothetical protein [Acidobacteriota bacterium]
MKRPVWIALVVLASSVSAVAQPRLISPPPPQEGWCATSPAMTEALKERHEWRMATRIGLMAEQPDRVIERDGVFIVQADESILVNDDPLDLTGRSVRFIPEDSGYVIETLPLDYEKNIGDLLVDFGTASVTSRRIDLPFGFPFHGTTYHQAYLTSRNGIHFEPPVPAALTQYEAFDAAAIDQAVISPLLLGAVPRTFVSPAVYVSGSPEEAVVTWRTDSTDFAYDVQAVLSADGTITLSWRSARDVSWGAVVVTPGIDRAEMSRQPVVTVEDVLQDGPPTRPDQDFSRVVIERLDGSDLLEVRIELQGDVRMSSIAPGEFVQYAIETRAGNTSRIVVHLTRDARWMLLPGRGWISNPGSLRIESSSIRFFVNDRDLERGDSIGLNAWIWDTAAGRSVDSVNGTYAHGYSEDSFELDLGAASGRSARRPIVESFTLPDMDPYAVWDLVAREYGLRAFDTDALAIYQDFFTDLVLYAGAYSTVGNPGVDGVASRGGYGSYAPLSPALLHMSRLGYRYNTTDELSTHVLNHEFGHRWLYFFEITENGESTHSLNPTGAHPAQFVHTPAAFDVRGSRNSSAMGGSWFEDRGDGTFMAREELASYGYSWHELYLMGLARADEVEPWFYIAESDPRLGDAYYPPDGIVVNGTRRDVSIDQLVESMGERSPDHDRSRKRFSTYFVLLVRDLEGLSPAKVDDLHYRRRLLHEAIPLATGGRAILDTLYEPPGPRRRGVQRR